MAAMAGKIASSEKNVTPPASVITRSADTWAATRFRMAHQPAAGISVGRAASRPCLAEPASTTERVEPGLFG